MDREPFKLIQNSSNKREALSTHKHEEFSNKKQLLKSLIDAEAKEVSTMLSKKENLSSEKEFLQGRMRTPLNFMPS